MKIQILGPGCANCTNLEKNARAAAETLGIQAEFEKITDMNQIMDMGVLRTPGFAVDGTLVKSGKVFSPEEIAEALAPYVS
ncbi:small redox-active disulfide protein 2 [Alkalispirochaeta americana]|uniref:Small redox-active disulfide protein 2 n=1 Tax=Alkalispirochaeta americana TaxID=159291 RepID=A0A1N6SHW7_9SPIO|nr:MTH895/ArsE family thioredoxin-like protein [Alkalispirochaeta americana]SIQ40708.1 small redox-active disulfide protein 2 [Alkalispirochaeta americana]